MSVTGAQLLTALFSEQESQAAQLLGEQGMTRIDAVNFIVHGVVKRCGDAAAWANCEDGNSGLAVLDHAKLAPLSNIAVRRRDR